MAVTARTWVTGELATAAKLNTLRDDVLDLDSRMSPKSIQHFTITINGSSSSTATITGVDTAKSRIVHWSWRGNTDDVRFAATGVITNSTTITATRETASGTTVVTGTIEESW